jgi:hypothetical protein
MSVTFQLSPIGGFAATAGMPGERAAVTVREMLTSLDGATFASRVDALHRSIFSRIPGLKNPWQLEHLLVVIKPSFEATAYANELQQTGSVRVTRSLEAGEAIYEQDIMEIASLDLGVDIPADCGFVLVRSLGWHRSLFYDFGPLTFPDKSRSYDLKAEFARQAFGLIKITGGLPKLARADAMKGALIQLELLLEDKVEDEGRYQEFLETNPWILGGHHSRIDRHTNLDDENIPDFTGVRHYDTHRDIVEFKQPFLPLFKKDGGFSAAFNDAWGQAERYLIFARRERDYLARKGLSFENPRCFLVAGYKLTSEQLRLIRDKESLNPAMTVLTYESVIMIGKGLVDLAIAAGK